MKLTDYYKMAKLPTCKSKSRFDCIASTREYEPFEELAQRCLQKRFKFYLTKVPDNFKNKAERKADWVISDTKNISSVYTPDLDNPLLGYGDVANTNDALLFLFNEDYTTIDVFVARGLKQNQLALYVLFADGELDDEIAQLRKQAKPTNTNCQDRADVLSL